MKTFKDAASWLMDQSRLDDLLRRSPDQGAVN